MKLFGRWETKDIVVEDKSLAPLIHFEERTVPHTFGRHAKKKFKKMEVNVVERLANKMMRGGTGEKTSGKVIRTHGRLQGKKLTVLKAIEQAFEIVEKKTKENPIQVFVRALGNAAPNEEVTRIAFGGVTYQLAVDISATRRLDMALKNIAMATILASFGKRKKMAEALADEIIYAANKDSQNSYAIKRKDETERIARSAR